MSDSATIAHPIVALLAFVAIAWHLNLMRLPQLPYRSASLLLGVVLLAACASTTDGRRTTPEPLPPPSSTPAPSTPTPVPPVVASPSLGWFSNIRVPDGHVPVLRLSGKGVQIFRCEARPGGYGWVFRLPEAELLDDRGAVVGRHGANFTFELNDGSRVLSTIVASDEQRDEKNLRWVLMSTRSFGKGELTGASYVQRINTVGGMPPSSCSAAQQNQLLRVNFSADFVFYKPQS